METGWEKLMELETVTLEFLMLADRAEVLNGKLYVMGGGYDRRTIDNMDVPLTLSMVVGVLVPWNLTNQPHTIRLTLQTEDGTTVGQQVQGQLTVGRSAQAISGQMFRVMTVVNVTTPLPRLGAYRVIATLDNGDSKAATFYAVSSETPAKQAG